MKVKPQTHITNFVHATACTVGVLHVGAAVVLSILKPRWIVQIRAIHLHCSMMVVVRTGLKLFS